MNNNEGDNCHDGYSNNWEQKNKKLMKTAESDAKQTHTNLVYIRPKCKKSKSSIPSYDVKSMTDDS